ncbi:GCN5-related N-acetyltransferase [Catenulispora acidiphila DSM 44928]|uniref:GCN5-related N-acetyltransferase n=1 Tax=Catenulispora acidiphila (strain DSM 44928 / JCM 14897 / NBRC 102108 / NRRL B-24433 / ID139908) TaxID=479433 RepID=C7Q1X7_CATAD|nr:GNAT family N-acetyltransferase [Catenulispora acidiphila]ACU75678.1 GCN5-related N-acetyltransferase [Catenulispora acidiphila DSM 44928]
MPSVETCEAVQTCWFTCRAAVLGGRSWTDGPLLWTREGDAQNLMFPERIPADAVKRAVEQARETGVRIIGAWLGAETDTSALAAAGFERGWEPWWMTAPVADVGAASDPRIELLQETVDYKGEYAAYAETLKVTRVRPQHTWYAAAYDDRKGRRFAGRAWSHLSGETAGVFDMNVWPQFQRRGLGSGLLRAVVAAAAEAGASNAVMNATPEGKLLYESCGFRQIGVGITWWLHLR